MLKRLFSLKLVYVCIFYISFVLYIMRQAIPMHDFFWAVWILLQAVGVVSALKTRKKLSITKIINSIFVSKIFITILVIYIVIDVINMTYGPDASLGAGKYIVFAQGMSYIVHVAILNNFYELKPCKFLEILYKCVIIAAISATILALVNFYYPIFNSSRSGQISIINDYNAFCAYFLFSYVIGFIYICDNKKISFYKKITFLSVYSVLLCAIMFMSTSRRTLLTLLALSFVLVIYYIWGLYKKCKVEDKTRKYFIKRVALSIVFIVVAGVIIVEGSNELLNFKAYQEIHAGESTAEYWNGSKQIADDKSKTNSSSIVKNDEQNSDTHSQINSENGKQEIDEYNEQVDQESINADKWNSSGQIVQGSDNTELQVGIEQAYSRISLDNFWGKRRIIWQEAINEIQTFNFREILFGKGDGYATEFYNTEPTRTVIQNAYGNIEIAENSMYPHNYLLQDMLEGGILKVIFALILTLGLAIKLIINLIKNGKNWIVPLLILFLIGTNIMISYSTGFIGDIYYNVLLLILIQIKLMKQDTCII